MRDVIGRDDMCGDYAIEMGCKMNNKQGVTVSY